MDNDIILLDINFPYIKREIQWGPLFTTNNPACLYNIYFSTLLLPPVNQGKPGDVFLLFPGMERIVRIFYKAPKVKKPHTIIWKEVTGNQKRVIHPLHPQYSLSCDHTDHGIIWVHDSMGENEDREDEMLRIAARKFLMFQGPGGNIERAWDFTGDEFD